jgi:hypothetical protein
MLDNASKRLERIAEVLTHHAAHDIFPVTSGLVGKMFKGSSLTVLGALISAAVSELNEVINNQLNGGQNGDLVSDLDKALNGDLNKPVYPKKR